MSLNGLKKLRYVAMIMMAITLVLLTLSVYFNHSVFMLITGGMFIISVVLHLALKVITPFIMDKILDIEALKQQGLTIVNCPNCHKKNVLEDQYCIYCQTPLGE
jgi:5-bromo-4-chloroindolyl phosphate hydrolysis protein